MWQQHFPHPSWIEIDLDQFKKNIAVIHQHIGKSLLCLPVKANAYGHGLQAMGKAAEQAGVDYLAVAHLQEGIHLRQANIRIPILVLGAIHEDQILDLINFNLEFSVSSKFKANLVAAKCKQLRQRCRVHLEVDTGMQRTGVRASSLASLFHYLKDLNCFEIIGVYSHLASAEHPNDPLALQQINAFQSILSDPIFAGNRLLRHIANSGGMVHYPQAHLDMVRPSFITFGYLPNSAPASMSAIAPCFALKTRVCYFKVVEKGAGISYGHSYYTPKQTRIVTLPVGYGDGYRRCLSNRAYALIRGKRFPIVGKICMDQMMVDVSDHEVYVGDEAVLIGKQGGEEITVREIAELCDTTPYEVLCGFNDRLSRIYLTAKR